MDQVCPLEQDTAEIRNDQDTKRDRNIGIDICDAYQRRRKEANDSPLDDIDTCTSTMPITATAFIHSISRTRPCRAGLVSLIFVFLSFKKS